VPFIFNRIQQGTLALPDFQRRFEWGVTDVRSYLSAVLAGLPAGSLLIADNSKIQVELRPLEGAPAPLKELGEVDVLLDGQQRLTALWQAASEVGPERYFVDFTALREGADLLQDGVVVSSSVRNLARFLSRAQLESRALVPFGSLLSAPHFFSWLRLASGPHGRQGVEEEALGEVFAESIQPIEKYSIPVIRLAGELDLSTVAQVFERTNKGGQRLDAFDLLVARLQGAGWSLRQAWEDALRSYPQIERVFGEKRPRDCFGDLAADPARCAPKCRSFPCASSGRRTLGRRSRVHACGRRSFDARGGEAARSPAV
jgi:hypothetical protein